MGKDGGWTNYSDIETAIIEEAFVNKEEKVILDDYHILFKQSVQISNQNWYYQRSVKRVIGFT